MEEVKKSKKNKHVKEAKEAKKVKAEAKPKVEVEKVEKAKEPKEEQKKEVKKEKKSKKGLIAALIVILMLVGGGIAAKMLLTKTSVTTETVELSSDARGFANYFREYLIDRAEAEELFSYTFRDLTTDEILGKLTELKDGFSKVSRGVAGNYAKSDYAELADVMKADADEYLSMVRELRAIMVAGYDSDGDRQLAFMRKVEEMSGSLRSAVYLSRAAFDSDVAGFSSKGVLAFEGNAMVEVGGGVANVFLGDLENTVVAVSTDDLDGAVKTIDAKKLYGYTGTRVFQIGESLRGELESGWFKLVSAKVDSAKVELTKTKISMVMKNVWSFEAELKEQGIKGLMETEKKSVAERLTEFLSGLKGKS